MRESIAAYPCLPNLWASAQTTVLSGVYCSYTVLESPNASS